MRRSVQIPAASVPIQAAFGDPPEISRNISACPILFGFNIEFIKGLCHIYVPNAFSPNGDVKNDVFKVAGTEMISVFDLQIYNRYGQLVYQTTDKTKGWDGTFTGLPLPSDDYWYTIKLEDGREAKGHFSLKR